jgi:hypothetical protein
MKKSPPKNDVEYAVNVIVDNKLAKQLRADVLLQFGMSPTESGPIGDEDTAIIYVFDDRQHTMNLMSMLIWHDPTLTIFMTQILGGRADNPKLLSAYYGSDGDETLEAIANGCSFRKKQGHA